jgi:4-amino-4-deoxy-L-arabinose transferase-like glycosyltransferase
MSVATPPANIQSMPVRRSVLLLVLLAGVTFLAGLGRPAIGDSDEAFYAEAGREMVESGDLLTPRYNYEVRFQKPALFYWLVSASYAVAGLGEAQARFWAALSGLGLTLVTLVLGRRSFDEDTGLLAGAMVATSFGYFSIAHLALPDLPLTFFITLTTLGTLAGTVDDDRHRSGWLVVAGAAAGCGFLTKGPVALVVPGLVVLPIWVLERRRLSVAWPGAAAGAALALAIGLPWYIAMAFDHGRAYLVSFFLGDNLERFATTRFNDPRPVWFYLPIVFGGLLPWTPLAAAWWSPFAEWVRRPRGLSSRTWRLLAWTLLPLAFYTASIGKQPRYVLPILPPLAVLLAAAVVQRIRARSGERDALLQVPTAIIALLLASLAVLLYRARPLIVMVPTVFVFAAIAAIALAAVVALAGALAPSARAVPVAVTLAGALVLVGLQYGLSPGGRDPVQDMASLVLRQRTRHEPIATYRVFVRNLIFYTGVRQTDLLSDQHVIDYLRSADPVLCVIAADDLDRIEHAGGLTTRVLGEVLYFNAATVKLRTLLSPDVSRDLDRVLLVTNVLE